MRFNCAMTRNEQQTKTDKCYGRNNVCVSLCVCVCVCVRERERERERERVVCTPWQLPRSS